MLPLLWSVLANFLIVELTLLTVIMLPLLSTMHITDIIKSPAFATISQWKDITFVSLLVPFTLLAANSIWQFVKWSNASQTDLLIIQCNMYIAGGTTLLWTMIWCAICLIERLGAIELELATTRKRLADAVAAAAASAPSAAAGRQPPPPLDAEGRPPRLTVVVEAAVEAERTRRELAGTRVDLERALERLNRAELDLSAMRRQAEGTNRAFDELLVEHRRLQERQSRSSASSGGDSGKKGN